MFDLYGFGDQLLQGAGVTLEVAGLSLVFGLALGVLGAAGKLSPLRTVRWPVELLTNLVRGVPEFLILLICYFSLPQLLSALTGAQIGMSPLSGGVCALSLVFGAYASETFRGAFLAVPLGQLEAGRAFGMSRVRVFRRILLPQSWRVALPGIGNLWQNLIKDTSLVSVLGLEEIMRKATMASQVTKKPFNFFLVASLMYMAFTLISGPMFHWLERRAARGTAVSP
jgi:polar amino acid transport system permease protein